MNRNFQISKETLDRIKLAKKYIENRYQSIIEQESSNKQHWKKIITIINSTAGNLDDVSQQILQKQTINKRLKRQRDRLENYRFHNIIGRGAFGQVRLAQNIATNEIVAIKRLQKKRLLEKKQLYNAYLQRDFMVNRTSTFLVQLKSAFQDQKYLYIAMEYVAGGDLLHLLIERDILTEEQTRFYIAEMILAIQQIHKMNYIHRDIKPDNVLIDKDGHVKISDFGLSKYLQKDNKITKMMSLSKIQKIQKLNRLKTRERIFSKVGTPDYISPEVLVDKVYDHSIDIWGVGVIMFQCLFGYPPFTDEDSKEVCHKVINWMNYLQFPSDVEVSTEAKMLILGMINEKSKRLSIAQIKAHPFFQSVKWQTLHSSSAPHIPKLKDPFDVSNFDKFDLEKPWKSSDGLEDCQSPNTIENRFNFPGFDYKQVSTDPFVQTIKSLQKIKQTQSISRQKSRKSTKKRLKTEQCQRSSINYKQRHRPKEEEPKKQKIRYSIKENILNSNKIIQKQNYMCENGAMLRLKPFKKVNKTKIEKIKNMYNEKIRLTNSQFKIK